MRVDGIQLIRHKMFIRVLILALVLLPLAAESTVGETLTRPSVEYRGELLMEAGRLALSGPIHYAPEKERRSLKLHGSRIPAKVIIIRRDKRVVWVLDPPSRSYYRAPLPKKSRGTLNRLLSGTGIEKTKVGIESLDGIRTTRYKVKFAENKSGRLVGDMWVTAENIVVRVSGKVLKNKRSTPFHLRLTDLKIGKQPDDVFEPPKGFKLVPASHPTMGVLVKPPASPGHGGSSGQ